MTCTYVATICHTRSELIWLYIFYLQYYFGDYNLVKDEFLLKAMEKNDGCILKICVMTKGFSCKNKDYICFCPLVLFIMSRDPHRLPVPMLGSLPIAL